MRRFNVSILVLVLAFGLAAAMPPAGASLPRVPSGPGYRGLIRNPDGICGLALFQLQHKVGGRALCTHGPDPVPQGVVAGHEPSPAQLDARAGGRTTAVPCVGDGTTGNRIQAIYAVAQGQTDQFATVQSNLQTYAADAESVLESSAAQTGGQRQFRWVTTGSGSSCVVSILHVVIPSGSDGGFDGTIQALQNLGYASSSEKYLIWVDNPANPYCGIGTTYKDDSASASNLNNGYAAQYAAVMPECWGLASDPNNGSVEGHEMMHTLGAVQNTSPNHTNYGHCTDEYDVMCYQDGAGTTLKFICPPSNYDNYDCNHDDYFSTNPAAGSYLATHWNTANSAWLVDPNLPTHVLSVHLAGVGAGTVGGGGLSCTADCSSSYPEGTTVHLTATPKTGSTFTGWSGACTGTSACNVTMSADKSATANFGVRPKYQPDLWIKSGSGKFLGNDVYSAKALGETAAAKGGRGAKKVFTVYLQIDGSAASDTIQVTGTGSSPGFKVLYSDRGVKLSAPNGALAVKPITLNGQQYVPLTVAVTILSNAAHGAVKTVTVMATSQHSGGAKDAVKAKVSVA